MAFFRILFLPFKLAAALVLLVLRVLLWFGLVPLRIAGGLARVVGFKGSLLFGGGVATGLLVAPGPGRELRNKLQGSISGGAAPTDADLAEKVRFELAHAPRTWHLEQPEVTVAGGRVVLSGSIAHEEGREELTRVATAVPGVSAVENVMAVGDDVVELAEELAEELVEELVAEAVAEELVGELVEAAEEMAEEIAEEIAEEMVDELVEEAEAAVADGDDVAGEDD